MKAVLLLIDLQNDYLGAAGLEPPSESVVAGASALLRGCRELSIPVIHVWTTVSREMDCRMPHWKRLDRWICEEGTPGHRPPDSLKPISGEEIVHKTFFSAFSNSDLDAKLRAIGATTVIVAGVHLHACVRQTALAAYERGFEVGIAEDAVGSDDPVHGAITQRYLASRVARFAKTAQWIEELSGDRKVGTKKSLQEPQGSPIEGARAALTEWRETPQERRVALLEGVAARLEKEAFDLARQMGREIGKPIRYGEMEVLRSAEMLRCVGRRFAASHDEALSPNVRLRRRPHGVVALITPWNNPVYIALGKIAPALSAGNTVVWKPSPHADGISLRLRDIFLSQGLPLGALSLCLGDADVAKGLMSDPVVAAVALTGSSLAGYGAQEICARRRIPLQAELGGNNAAIVWDDCDLKDAARKIADGAFAQAGQRCTANRRVIVHEAVYEEMLTRLVEAAAELPSGDPLQSATRIGPLVSEENCTRVAALMERCASQGIRIISIKGIHHGKLSAAHKKAWHPPVIVCCDDPHAEIIQEETFGPVMVVQRAATWEQAMERCNGVRQGLAAALFSSSMERRQRFLKEAQAGLLKFNQSTADAEVDVPFGGWKSSGIGPPEHGRFDEEFYLRPQTCYSAPEG